MTLRSTLALFAILSFSSAFTWGQTAAVTNPNTAKWTHASNDPPGSESVVLREDAKTGGLELLARYPAGHVFKPHWHESNERILLLEGRLSLTEAGGEKILEPGGFAFLPAREVQKMACVSNTRCTFYVSWDGNPASRPPAAP